jgi:hypothetical protein
MPVEQLQISFEISVHGLGHFVEFVLFFFVRPADFE